MASCKLPELKKIFLVHGEAKALEGMKEKLIEAGYPNPEIVKPGESYSL
jgi:metallo-beta-lactamase family protein